MDSAFPKPYDDDIQDVAEGMVIVIDGDTAPKAISAGQYLFIKNHSTLPTGGYHATAAIASGDTISSSNVIIDADGIANAIKGNIDALNSKLAEIGTITYTTSTVVSALAGDITKVGRIALARFDFTMTAGETSSWIDCGTVSIKPAYDVTLNVMQDANAALTPARVRITESGLIRVFYGSAGSYHVNVAYRCTL